MLTRRFALLASAASPRALPAAAQPATGAQKSGAGAAARRTRPAGTPATRRSARSIRPPHCALILDFNTGATLLEKDADVAMPPSSMTKLMTIYIVYERLKQGKLTLTTSCRSASARGAWRARRCSCRSARR